MSPLKEVWLTLTWYSIAMPHAKIDRILLNEHLSQNKTQAECARAFNVSEAAISKAVRRFNLVICQDVATRQAGELAARKETLQDTLLDLIEKYKSELEWIEKNHPASNEKDYKGWQDQKLKQGAEIRKVIASLVDARVKIYHVESVEKALAIMYEEISKESNELKKRITDRFRRAAIHFDFTG